MLGLRLNPPRPYWFEDLVFFVLDEGRRLPDRIKHAAVRTRHIALRLDQLARSAWRGNAGNILFAPIAGLLDKVGTAENVQPEIKIKHVEAALLDEPLSWSLATEPLAAVATGAEAAISLHKAAAEQLDALTYVLDRMRDELRPLMTYAPLEPSNPVIELHTAAELDTSIEALLELSRQNAATRPKGRVLTAA